MRRTAAVAGQFYSGSPFSLKSEVSGYLTGMPQKEKAIGIVSPHAGLMYSGHVAGAVYSSIEMPRTFVLIGPNHTGHGPAVSVMSSGQWDIPTASVHIDGDLAKRIAGHSPLFSEDVTAHRFEHSLEVQLPFIVQCAPGAAIVPITMMKASVADCLEIGNAVAAAIRETSYPVVIAASTDMSHYVSDTTARRLDGLAIDAIIRLNPEELYTVIVRERITMCGYIPSTVMLYAALALGASHARLVKYATSGEISGDYSHVVGYAGLIIT